MADRLKRSHDLTSEQREIVEHQQGRAVVFAVPGAGKTTSLVHRVVRLVRDDGVLPNRILLSTFSRAGATDISTELKRIGSDVAAVRVRTSHSLSLVILKDAQKARLVPSFDVAPDPENAPKRLLSAANATRRRSGDAHDDRHNYDADDFLEYVAACKANLQFPNLSVLGLPMPSLATQANPPSPVLAWYSDLHRHYEGERERRAWLTFDDFAPQAWIALEKSSELRKRWHRAFDYIMVDEYQDMSLSQVAMFEHLCGLHNNMVVVGDDDQAIYDWRGASKRFLMEFGSRPDSRTFTLGTSFRLHAEHAAIANHVISANLDRHAKSIYPVKGFGGVLTLSRHHSSEAMARAIGASVKDALANGVPASDVVLIVRRYSESAAVESEFIAEKIPYTVIGQKPFFERPEAGMLLALVEAAILEVHLGSQEDPPHTVIQTFARSWKQIVRLTSRYVSNATAEAIQREVIAHGIRPSIACQMHLDGLNQGQQNSLTRLATALARLSDGLRSGYAARPSLFQLIVDLDYLGTIKDSSVSIERAEDRVAEVQALPFLATPAESLGSLLERVRRIRQSEAEQEGNRIAIMTAFRAKGLEWTHVIIPAINDRHFPARDPTEEERRIFYVALTRSRNTLEMHELVSRPYSPFMNGLPKCLDNATTAAIALQRRPSLWRRKEAIALAATLSKLPHFVADIPSYAGDERREMASWVLSATDVLRRDEISGLDRYQSTTLRRFGASDPARMGERSEPDPRRPEPEPVVASAVDAAQTVATKRFHEGARVNHPELGSGVVVGFGHHWSRRLVEVQFVSGRSATFSAKDAQRVLDVLPLHVASTLPQA